MSMMLVQVQTKGKHVFSMPFQMVMYSEGPLRCTILVDFRPPVQSDHHEFQVVYEITSVTMG